MHICYPPGKNQRKSQGVAEKQLFSPQKRIDTSLEKKVIEAKPPCTPVTPPQSTDRKAFQSPALFGDEVVVLEDKKWKSDFDEGGR